MMYHTCRNIKYKYLFPICDVMGRNQSHVVKHKMAEICIFSENVKICPFLFSSKTKYLCKFKVT